MKRVNLLTTELQSGVEGSNNLLSLFKKKVLKNPILTLKRTRFKVLADIGQVFLFFPVFNDL